MNLETTSPFCASGGTRSLGRSKLLKILETKKHREVALELRCCRRYVGLIASGKRRPRDWQFVRRMRECYGIMEEDWSIVVADSRS
jgi:hypothetical protein